MRAKKEGDWLRLNNVNLPDSPLPSPKEVKQEERDGQVMESERSERNYFSPRRKKRKSRDPSEG